MLLQLPLLAQAIALASLLLVAAYPFMKRITWWPQAWLGLTFNWGLLVGWAALAGANWAVPIAVYLGCVLWTIGYDTIYALQDREDDAMVGIRSSALRMGGKVKQGVAACYAGAVGLWAVGFWLLREDWVGWLTLVPVAWHFAWQVVTLDENDPDNPLARFRSNRWAGFLLAGSEELSAEDENLDVPAAKSRLWLSRVLTSRLLVGGPDFECSVPNPALMEPDCRL